MLNALVTPFGRCSPRTGERAGVRGTVRRKHAGRLSSRRHRPRTSAGRTTWPAPPSEPIESRSSCSRPVTRLGVAARRPRLSPSIEVSSAADVKASQRTAYCSTSPVGGDDPGHSPRRRRDPRRMRAQRRHADHFRSAEPLAAVAPDRPLYADHRRSLRRSSSEAESRQSRTATHFAIAAS